MKLQLLKLVVFVLNIIFPLTNQSKYARCFVIPTKNNLLSGLIHFFQENANTPVKITGKIYGASKIHAFHIHENKVSDGDCVKAGNDFNPLNMKHGGPNNTVRHVGDLGNLKAEGGVIDINMSDDFISLYSEFSIIDKTCVIHLSDDDMGNNNGKDIQESGNSGIIIACGVVQNHYKFLNYIFGFLFLILPLAIFSYYFFVDEK